MCDPLDYYCYTPTPYDQGIINFYEQNTGIPGSIPRPAPRVRQLQEYQGTAGLRALFGRTEYLPYAAERYKQMKGASPFSGELFEQYNVMNYNPNPTPPSNAGFVTNPSMMFGTRQEKCGCSKPSSLMNNY